MEMRHWPSGVFDQGTGARDAGDRLADVVRVAVVAAVGQAVDEGAPAVHQDAGGRKGDALAEQPGQLAPADALAAQDGVEVGQQQFDGPDVGIRREKIGCFRRHVCAFRGHAFPRQRF